MFKRLMEWVKGGTYTTEVLVDVVTFEGKVPQWMNYPEEPYRIQVWVYRTTTRRDAQWVSPILAWRYVVKPLSKHRIPIDRRGRSITVYETSISKEMIGAYSATDAVQQYLLWIKEQRVAFEDEHSDRN